MVKKIVIIVVGVIVIGLIVMIVSSINSMSKLQEKANQTISSTEEKREKIIEDFANQFGISKEEAEKLLSVKTTEHYKDSPLDLNDVISIIDRNASQSSFKSVAVAEDKVYIHTEGNTLIYYWKYYNAFGGVNQEASNALQVYCYQINNQ